MQVYIAGKIITMAGADIVDGQLLVREGKIIAVGSAADRNLVSNLLYQGESIEYNDFGSAIIFPGIIDSHCHVGIAEEIYSNEDDTNESSEPITPQLRVIDAINHEDPAFQDALAAGITTVIIAPGSGNILGGEVAALKTSGSCVDEMLLRAPLGLKAALGENPKQEHGERDKMPMTRMASAALLREYLVQAETYLSKMEDEEEDQDRDLKLESIGRVLRQEIPLRVHAHRADDIMTAVRIAREFALRLIIEHGTGAAAVAEQLAQHRVPVIVGPLLVNRAKVEMKDISMRNPLLLYEKGVDMAFMTDHPVVPVQYLVLQAALAVRAGLPEREAWAMLTCNAARITGLADRIGSLEVGKDADFVVLNGPLLAFETKVQTVFIEGRQVYQRV